MRNNGGACPGGLEAVAAVNRGENVEARNGVWEPTVRVDFRPIGSWTLGDTVLALWVMACVMLPLAQLKPSTAIFRDSVRRLCCRRYVALLIFEYQIFHRLRSNLHFSPEA